MNDKAVFAGNLSFIELADVFQILGGNGSTGILRISSQYTPNPGIIHFVNGDPVNASNGPLKALEAIYAVFGWTEGRFEFNEKEVQGLRQVKNSRMEIVLDALRMVDDGIIKKVGPPSFDDVRAAKTGGAGAGLGDSLHVLKGPLVDYGHIVGEEEFRDGEAIVREGGHGKWIWVILHGTVDVCRKTPGGLTPVSRLGEGCYIGAPTALSFRQSPRSATVKAVGSVQLGVLDTERLSREYESLSWDFKRLLLSLEGRLTKISDRLLALSMKKDDKIETLAKDKKVFIKKGSSKEEVFAIKRGEACVVVKIREEIIPLFTLKSDDLIGYLPFLDIGHEPRSAWVLASEELEFTELDPQSLQKEYDQLSGTFRNMIYSLGTCIFATTKEVYRCLE